MKCPLHWTHVTRYIKSKKDLIINSSLFHKHLFWTNIGISVALSGAGDYFIQRHESGSNNRHIDYKSSTCQKSLTAVRWNPKRSCHMAISFGLTSGFLCHFWYKFLDTKIQGNTIKAVTKKIIWDQILFSPILIVACLFVAGMMDSSSPKDIKNDIRDKGRKIYTLIYNRKID